MLQFTAGGVDLHPYATAYDIDISPVEGGNGFTDINGNEVRDIIGYKTIINCTLEKVPHAVAQSIAEVMQHDGFSVAYTTPAPALGTFCCTKYKPKIKCADPRQKNPLVTNNITWSIPLTLESTVYAVDSSSL